MNLSQYKDMFGKPGEGSHSIRIPIVDLALVDVIATIIVAYVFYYFNIGTPFVNFLVLFAVGQLMHYAFGVETAFLKKFY